MIEILGSVIPLETSTIIGILTILFFIYWAYGVWYMKTKIIQRPEKPITTETDISE